MNTTQVKELYDVIFFWNNPKNPAEYRQYCGETICHILEYPAALSVKIVFEAEQNGKALLYSTRNLEKAVEIRDSLCSLNMLTEVVQVKL